MEQFTYIGRSRLNIHCPKLTQEEAFVMAIENACAAIKNYSKKAFIQFVDEQGEPIDFWGKLLEDPKRYPLAGKYLIACMERLKENKFLFEDECPLGSYVAYKLALTDKYFLPLYAKLLGHWDMDHEVEEIEYISEIVNHHGWCKEVGDIIIARSSVGCGQYGFDQLNDFESFIRQHNEPLLESPFFISLIEAIIKEHGTNAWKGTEDAENIFGSMASAAIEVRERLTKNEKEL